MTAASIPPFVLGAATAATGAVALARAVAGDTIAAVAYAVVAVVLIVVGLRDWAAPSQTGDEP